MNFCGHELSLVLHSYSNMVHRLLVLLAAFRGQGLQNHEHPVSCSKLVFQLLDVQFETCS